MGTMQPDETEVKPQSTTTSKSEPKAKRVEVVIQQRKTTGKGIASMLFAFLCFPCSFLAWIPAVLLGISVLRDTRKQPLLNGKILAIVSISFATFGLLVNGTLAVILGLPALQTIRLMESREN